MLLRDTLDDAVAGVTTDLTALAASSRRRGLAIRRRRRTLATVGSLAAVSALALGAPALAPAPDRPSDPGVATGVTTPGARTATKAGTPAEPRPAVPPPAVSPPAASDSLSGETAPITAGGTAAALVDAVTGVADGTVSRVQGSDHTREGFAALLLEPRSGSGPAGQVMINLQPLAGMGRPPYTCEAHMEDCAVRELADGDTLRTYWERDDTEFGTGSQRLAVEVLSPKRRLRVVVNSLNTHPWADGRMRDEPVLTLAQATEVATLPWWSRSELPVEHVRDGETIELYDEG